MKGLLIRDPWIDKILDGNKTWEIRGRRTAARGQIGLIRSGSGQVVGVCDLVDVVGPLSLTQLQRNATRAGIRIRQLPYEKTYAWVFENATRLPEPVPYRHPAGAVIWVRLTPTVCRRVMSQL